jgi:hypothetical protein
LNQAGEAADNCSARAAAVSGGCQLFQDDNLGSRQADRHGHLSGRPISRPNTPFDNAPMAAAALVSAFFVRFA